jgi:hypothetical protein
MRILSFGDNKQIWVSNLLLGENSLDLKTLLVCQEFLSIESVSQYIFTGREVPVSQGYVMQGDRQHLEKTWEVHWSFC